MKQFSIPAVLAVTLFILMGMSLGEGINLYWQDVIMFMGINIILSASLNLVNGYMGEFSCGHAGFMAVGAYVSSLSSVALFTRSSLFGAPILSAGWAVPLFPLCLLAGMAAAAISGLLVAIPSFKTRGDYLAIITIAASFIIKSSIENIKPIGGARGFMGMGQVSAAMSETADLPWMMFWIFLGTVFTIWILRRFVSSTYGKGILAISQDEIAAEIMSVNTNKMKIVAFMLSSGLAGLAGGLYAHKLGYVNPGSFTILKSTECLVMVYLGGMGSLSGAVLSAVVYTLMLEILRFVIPWINDLLHWAQLIPAEYQVTQIWKWVLIPLLLVLLMQFRPEGIMGRHELDDYFPWIKKFYRFK
ncbi:MAG: branched-chain amino acid ABC transporter permease [Deltaproteobacteria bacterium]|nr:branched-chain amino acid ABC transporter permease [Deltaproteobacteria bacterium]